ncbi:MAG TPA: cyclic pyranopterin monophosphate synthase MoaC [Gemmatimonadaceae bacterium]|nr:cyclic pyranopterin monophosphate synthase MoaC [Gemmatimonadaceae bacterium]
MSELSHVDRSGQARMVDVSAKETTERFARATGVISMSPEALAAVRRNAVEKGDVLGVARIAGVMAAKRTAELIPLCHPLLLTDVQVIANIDDAVPGIRVESTVRTAGKTGVEMEAILAVAVTLVTVYDMCKSLDKSMVISDICLSEKTGGRSGTWKRP